MLLGVILLLCSFTNIDSSKFPLELMVQLVLGPWHL